MTSPEEHVAEYARRFTDQDRFSRVSFRVDREGVPSILIEGYVSTVSDFHSLQDEWAATIPPATTSVFVHIDPLR